MDPIPPSKAALSKALSLSDEILRNIELNEIPLTNIALKTARLARLVNDFEQQKIMEYEAGGYPIQGNQVPSEVWRLGTIAGRHYIYIDPKTNKQTQTMDVHSIGQLEETLRASYVSLGIAQDPNVSISSSNPGQFVQPGTGNVMERGVLRREIFDCSGKLASRKSYIYRYVMQKHYELMYSGISDDIFTRIRLIVDTKIGSTIPDAVQKFTAIYDNLQSENPEDWSNAVHGCRRLLQSLADVVFPPSDNRTKEVNGKTKTILLGKEHYKNRLITFVEDNSKSERFNEIVGSHLGYLGDRLDSVYEAANKGSHDTIVSREEADRYVIFTYLLIGDILNLYLV